MSRQPLKPCARWALTGLCLATLMPSLDTSIANAGLPTLAVAFDASFQQVQWIVLAYLLAVTTLIVSAGRLGDLFGRRRLLLIGIGVFSAASLACALASAWWWLIAARAVQGLGAAIMLALTLALVNAAVPKERAGSAMGLLGTMSAIGTSLGPSLGGLLIAHVGWPWMFLLNLPLGVLNGWLVHRYLPRDEVVLKPQRFDLCGTGVLALTLAAYALAMTRNGEALLSGGLLLLSVLGSGLFIVVEKRVGAPLLQLSLLRDARLRSRLAMTLLVATVMMTTLVVGPFYLSRGLGLDSAALGLALSLGPSLAALGGVPAGRLVDRFGARRMLRGALIAMLGGCSLLALLPMRLGLPGYLLPMALLTLGYALFQAANNSAVMATAEANQRGVVAALLGLARNLGLISGAAAMGALFAAASADPTQASPGAIAGAVHLTFALATGLLLLALSLASVATRVRAGAREPGKTVRSR